MGDYSKTTWSSGDLITAAKANNWETQYDVAKAAFRNGEWTLQADLDMNSHGINNVTDINSGAVSLADGDIDIASGKDYKIDGAVVISDPVTPSGKFAKDDGTWATPVGSGDVVGPSGVTADSNVPLYDTTSGKLLKDSLLKQGASGEIYINTHKAVSDPTGSPTGKFAKDDGTWATPTASATYTSQPDYLIYKDGSLYYAKNTRTGTTDYSGSAFHTVMNNTITALSSGGTIAIMSGEYTLTATINVNDHINIIGYGAKLSTADSTIRIFTINGGALGGSHALTSAVEGTNTIALADSSVFTVGEYITLYSSDLYHPSLSGSYRASIHKVMYIPDSTHIQLSDTVPYTYTTSPIAYHTTLKHEITIEGLELVGASATSANHHEGVYCNRVRDITLKNLKVSNFGTAGISLCHTINAIVDGCRVSDCHETGEGYGISINDASHDIAVSNCTVENCNHGASNGMADWGIPYNIVYSQCVFRFNDLERQHPHGMSITFDACIFDSCGGISVETKNCVISNCTIKGSKYTPPGNPSYNTYDAITEAISIGASDGYTVNCRLVNNYIEYCGTDSTGTYFNGVTVTKGENCLISGNTIKVIGTPGASTNSAILITPTGANNSDSITITDNVIETTANNIAIRISTSVALTKLRIIGNSLSSGDTECVSFSGPVTDWVISENKITSTSGKGIYLVTSGGSPAYGVLSQNIIRTTGDVAIVLYHTCHDIAITGNVIYTSDQGIWTNCGSGTEAYNLNITGNVIDADEDCIEILYAHDVVISGNTLIISSEYGVYLNTNAIDVSMSGNNIVGTIANFYSIAATALRATIDGIGTNGANDPNSAGDWNTKGRERVMVKWNNGGTHYLSIYTGGAWYDWTIT